MLTNTDTVIGAVDQVSGQLVAFARVLTDGVFKALIYDVIVAPDFRNRGLGTRLEDAIREHPQLRDERHLEPYCLPEMSPL
jgi:ribosomal protein S18 acetylase RimI-like enzyme